MGKCTKSRSDNNKWKNLLKPLALTEDTEIKVTHKTEEQARS